SAVDGSGRGFSAGKSSPRPGGELGPGRVLRDGWTRARLAQQELGVADVPLGEAALAVRKVVLPQPEEALGEAECADAVAVLEAARAPAGQDRRVVRPDLRGPSDAHPRGAQERLLDLGQRRQLAAGEDVALDEVGLPAVRGEAPLVHPDRLEKHRAAGL